SRIFPFAFRWQAVKESIVARIQFVQEFLYLPESDSLHGKVFAPKGAGIRSHRGLPLLSRHFRLSDFESFRDLHEVPWPFILTAFVRFRAFGTSHLKFTGRNHDEFHAEVIRTVGNG